MKRFSRVDTVSGCMVRSGSDWVWLLETSSTGLCTALTYSDSCAALVGHEVQPSAWTSVQTAGKFSWWSSRGWWDPEMYINMWAIWKQQENSKWECDCWRTWSQLVWKCLKQSLLSLSVPVLGLYKQMNLEFSLSRTAAANSLPCFHLN